MESIILAFRDIKNNQNFLFKFGPAGISGLKTIPSVFVGCREVRGFGKREKPYYGEDGVIGAGAAPLFEPRVSALRGRRFTRLNYGPLINIFAQT